MSSPKQNPRERTIDLLEHLDDEVPISDDDAKAILAEAGIDAAESLNRLFAKIDEGAAKERAARFARAETSRLGALERLKPRNDSRARPELLAQLQRYKQMHPGVSAHFRNFERMETTELRSLLAEIEELIRREEDE